jgi:hypothetical protein
VAWEVIDTYADTQVSWIYLQCSGAGGAAIQAGGTAAAQSSERHSTLMRKQE